MKKISRSWVCGLLFVLMMGLVACGVQPQGAPAAAPTATPVPTQAPPTPVPTQAPPTPTRVQSQAPQSPSTATPLPLPLTATPAPTLPPVAAAGQDKIVRASMGAEFQLQPKETAAVGSQGVTVEFVGVTEDSRCPQGVTCVRAGNVVLTVRVGQPGQPSQELSLSTATKERMTKTVDGVTVTLVKVDPVKTVQAIDPGQYVITLVVKG